MVLDGTAYARHRAYAFRIDRWPLLCVVALHNVKIKIPRFSRNLETDFVKMLC